MHAVADDTHPVELTTPLRERFEAVLRAHGPALLRLCRAYEADAARAADLHQDVLAALWAALATYEGRAALRTWVFRVAHNTAITHVTRSARNPTVLSSIEDLEALATAAPTDLEREVDHKRQLARLYGVLQALKPDDRALVTLCLEGLSPAELAEVSGLSANHVRVKLHRIRALLRRRLGVEVSDGE